MARKKLSRSDAIELLYNIDISDEELAHLVCVDEQLSGACAPVLTFNPATVVDEGDEADIALGFLNRISRWRRNSRYRRQIRKWKGVRVVSEGDSWFQYPLLLKDVVDHLCDPECYQYAVYSLGSAGDLLADIYRQDEISQALEQENPHVLLLSGGGNDMVSDGRIAKLVDVSAGKPSDPQSYLGHQFEQFLDDIQGCYRKLYERYLVSYPHLKIISHGYDRAIPNAGKWLGKPLAKAGIRELKIQKLIVGAMIDRFNEAMMVLQNEFCGSVFHVDARGAVNRTHWHDELHPDNQGYAKVAARFDQVIRNALAQERVSAAIKTGFSHSGQKKADDVATIANVCQVEEKDFEQLVYARAVKVLGDSVAMPGSHSERKKLEQRIDQYFEKIHRDTDFLPYRFLEQGVERAQAVCRIVTDTGFGSGFMVVSRKFIMTNHHVLPSEAVAREATAQFDYDQDQQEYPVRLAPEHFFFNHRDLDYAICALADHALPDSIRPIPLRLRSAQVTRGERVNIVQHPQGRRKEVSLHDNKVSYVYDKVIQYRADTEPGSSGSPVFNNEWQLVALHHKGWLDPEGGAINQGVRMSAIVDSLNASTEALPAIFMEIFRQNSAADTDADTVDRVAVADIAGRRPRHILPAAIDSDEGISLFIQGKVSKITITVT